MENNPNKKVNNLMYAVVFMAFISTIAILLIASVGANYLVDSKYDSRSNRLVATVKRGSVLDRNHEVLTYSEKNEDGYVRISKYPGLFSHVIGYVDKKYGTTGLESLYNPELMGRGNASFITKTKNIILNEKTGENLILALDLKLQQKSQALLKNFNGAIVVSNPKTGEILASYSNPTYDERKLSEFINNENESSMLNRVQFGRYSPGSVMKILTSINLLQNNFNENYEDTGSIEIGDAKIANYNNMRYGTVDMKKAFAHSLNTYFVWANLKYLESFKNLIDSVNKTISESSIVPMAPIELSLSDDEFSNALLGIGQGKVTLSPMILNIITESVYNGGYFYTPRYVNSFETEDVKMNKKLFSKKIIMPFSEQIANQVKDYMKEVVATGTASGFGLKNAGGKTGTAELGNGKYNYFFTGFYENEENPKCITIVLENCSNIGYNKTVEIFKKLLMD
ncbi:penicillin-binding transpeptidase domain-containing protein [Ezakiella coagulans]|uniref:penicillin-binding transpeptidase domain-containing protein n=1 Tax=Ezakiella coagulans TaxID=46507 RepID=UPI002014BEB2|nr:penicillin-binding transpeptidase domain-containing protein [Ezakiella coagulans]UQK60779.1 penicillin-binding transpeptidase domain-containing protein [Ezakiella coagulans]